MVYQFHQSSYPNYIVVLSVQKSYLSTFSQFLVSKYISHSKICVRILTARQMLQRYTQLELEIKPFIFCYQFRTLIVSLLTWGDTNSFIFCRPILVIPNYLHMTFGAKNYSAVKKKCFTSIHCVSQNFYHHEMFLFLGKINNGFGLLNTFQKDEHKTTFLNCIVKI